MSTEARTRISRSTAESRSEGNGRSAGVPPVWRSLLAVIAHPDEASAGLGAILDAFFFAGTGVDVLCLTHGQTWTLHGAPGDLAALRGAELASAADVLGPQRAKLSDPPDGSLDEVSPTRLAAEVVAAAGSCHPDGLLVFQAPAMSGYLDHVAATSAGLLAAESLSLPVLGWTLPETAASQLKQEQQAQLIGHPHEDIDLRVTLDRARQRLASHAQTRQTPPGSAPWRRLDLLADTDSLHWLRPPGGAVGAATSTRPAASREDTDGRPMRVEHRGGDRFDINVRGHVISVDQPVSGGGEDTAPTPTELFIASLASCVAFYARRYLARHDLPTDGLAVEATFVMGSRPARVIGIDLSLVVPGGVPAERLDALLAVATHCTVHNTLASTPEVSVTLKQTPAITPVLQPL